MRSGMMPKYWHCKLLVFCLVLTTRKDCLVLDESHRMKAYWILLYRWFAAMANITVNFFYHSLAFWFFSELHTHTQQNTFASYIGNNALINLFVSIRIALWNVEMVEMGVFVSLVVSACQCVTRTPIRKLFQHVLIIWHEYKMTCDKRQATSNEMKSIQRKFGERLAFSSR